MPEFKMKSWSSPSAAERLPWWLKCGTGILVAAVATFLTYSITPLRPFPLLLALPTVILSGWFLGMQGAVACALAEMFFVDSFLTRPQLRFSVGNAQEGVRLTVFFIVSILISWAMRKLAEQRQLIATSELQQYLLLANSERQLAEERTRTLELLRDRDAKLQVALEANGMGLWVWEFNPPRVDWSDEVFRIFGRKPGSIEPGIDVWRSIIHPDDMEAVNEALRLMNSGQVDIAMNYRIVLPDGVHRSIESRGKAELDREGRVMRVVGVLSDVTQQKHAEEAMLRAEKLAIAGRLAATVAHEINNPLEAVSNLVFLISISDSLSSSRQLASDALDQLMRVSMITQQTLKFHRQSGSPHWTRLSEVLNTVMGLFRAKLIAAGIETDIRVEDEDEILCLPNEAQQIFSNLLSNAIDATPSKGRLAIRLRRSFDWKQRDRKGMRITFCDTGTGMNRTTKKRIFEPFFTTKAETGTGLGMWVVAQLIERHLGDIRVWSTQRTGRSGTAFSIFLPFHSDDTVLASVPTSTATSARSSRSRAVGTSAA